ncbi:hypothetical protein VTP01DRAFT_7508 [Rhizomucor pusillus]|uniref:uncharacterized protein n=1 Tax=Rhizomucor pusillus TaxID=4840 RepID=UPI003743511B
MLERSELEILILETSNALDATTPTKRAFDFHKAMFGAVAMLKSIADKYKYADFSVFSALKIYFLHVADAEIRLWSVQNFQKIFLVVREKKSGVPSSEDDEDTLFAYIEFFWILKNISKTLETLEVVRKNDKENKSIDTKTFRQIWTCRRLLIPRLYV